MVGLHIYHNLDGINKTENHLATLQLEEWHIKNEYYNDSVFSIGYSHYDGYPINLYSDDEQIIVYEGMIYNRTREEIYSFCKSLEFHNEFTISKKRIEDFVATSDGDFIILLYSKATGSYVIFNDIMGRLPLYYYFDHKRFIAGRSIPYMLHNIPQISIDKNALTEFLMIEFIIGKDTFFKDIQRSAPAEIIWVNVSDNHLNVNLQKSAEDCFDLINPFVNKKEALDELVRLSIDATQKRIEKSKSDGYAIINTLSGGFDSRAVFGAIQTFTHDFTNVTYEYVQDESAISRQLIDKTHSASKFIKLSFHNQVHYDDSSLQFRTGNGVNIYTNSICYNDALFLKNSMLKSKHVLFGGFGGEFIRHPYYTLPISSYNFLCYLYSCIPVQALLPVLNISAETFRNFLMATLNRYKDQSRDAEYKHLYNEYYRNYVVGVGEDRMRMFIWTIQPLMAASFLRSIRMRVPLRWSDFRFFTDFLAKIDSRLLDVPVFGKKANLHDRKSVDKLTSYNQKYIRSIIAFLAKKYGWLFYRRLLKDKSTTIGFDAFDFYYQKLDFGKRLLNYAYIKKDYDKWPLTLKYRLLSVVEYLYELEKHYAFKLAE
jgi:hypothetical protein